jgi:multicomponent Na+:H+ antiporter subunit G
LRDIVTIALMLFGAFFMLLAAVGTIRLPDLFSRMHAATKSGTLGVTGVILAVAVHFGEIGVTTRSLLIIVFMLSTAPVAAHMIARAAYRVGVPMWEKSVVDELAPEYAHRTDEGADEGAPVKTQDLHPETDDNSANEGMHQS